MKESRDADFSPERIFRYTLAIQWGDLREQFAEALWPQTWKEKDRWHRSVQFIGLNPSTADEFQDDPTVRRCKQFAKNWGYGGMVMTNIFAFRSTDPARMKRYHSPVGLGNDCYLLGTARECGLHVACWGNHGAHHGRGDAVRKLMADWPLKAFRLTKAGQPQHPLYMPYAIELVDL